MAVPGKPFKPEYISDIILLCKGNINLISDYYDVTRGCIYEYIKAHPELNDVLASARGQTEWSMLDGAEDIMEHGLTLKEKNYKHAFEAARYILDKKGWKRGWGTDGKTSQEKSVESQLGSLLSQSEDIYNSMKPGDK